LKKNIDQLDKCYITIFAALVISSPNQYRAKSVLAGKAD